mgnify:CR=1 FL=1
MWYVFTKDGECVCTSDHKPNIEDLSVRQETAVESNKALSVIEVCLKNGVVEKKEIISPPSPESHEPYVDETAAALAEAVASQEAEIAALKAEVEALKGGDKK